MEANINFKRNHSSILTRTNYTSIIKKVIAFTFLVGNLGFGQQDKVKHFVAGAAISGATYEFTYKLTNNRKKAFWYGLGAATLAGIAKEVYDINGTGFDNKDIAATIAGGLTINITIYAITKAKSRRKSKRFHPEMYE